MADYIERDKAVAKITELINQSGKYTDYECGADDACFIVAHLPAADVRPVVQREAVMQALRKYFSIGDSDTYELTRVKEAFYVGTMTLDDFEEWNEDNVSDLCDYLMKELFYPNCGADCR